MKYALICDFDNTLYNWIDAIVPAYRDMLNEVAAITGREFDEIVDEFSTVNRDIGTIERPFSILEIETIKIKHPEASLSFLKKKFDPAFYAFNKTRKENLSLYEGVRETLEELVARGITVIGYTDSNIYSVVDRMTRLDIDKYIDTIYCSHVDAHDFDTSGVSDQNYFDRLSNTTIHELHGRYQKPRIAGLRKIIQSEALNLEHTLLVGDSLRRDILPANRLGLKSVLAKYGQMHSPENIELLVRLSHWDTKKISRERNLTLDQNVQAEVEISKFSELKSLFN